jgi:hypothetical protein
MARYTFTCEHFDYGSYEGLASEKVVSRHTIEFRAADLTTMLENFELFLRGSGFHFNGVIDVVDPGEEQTWSDEEDYDPDVRVMEHLVADLLRQQESKELKKGTCEVCKLPLETMLQHNCYDDQCPLKMK